MPTPAAASLDLPASAAASLDLCASAVTYPGRPERVRQARAAARGLLAGCPATDEVILCLSELAANAVLHSDSRRPGGTFTVRIESCPGAYIRIWPAHVLTGIQPSAVQIGGRVPASNSRSLPRPEAGADRAAYGTVTD